MWPFLPSPRTTHQARKHRRPRDRSPAFRPRVENLEGRLTPSGPPASVLAIAGTPQTAAVRTTFATPFQALVEDSSGNPVGAGVSVTFAVSDYTAGIFPGGSQNVTVLTDSGGIATAPTFTAGYHTASYNVNASVAGVSTPASFDLTNAPGPAALVLWIAGTMPQAATAGTAYGTPFEVAVADAFQNRVGPGVAVTFTAPASGPSGTFAGGGTSATETTDALYHNVTAPTFTANNLVGDYVVTATVAGGTTAAVFEVRNVGPDAIIDGAPGLDVVSLSSAGEPGSLACYVYWGGPKATYSNSTLTHLTSFTFNSNGGEDVMRVHLDPGMPPLPGLIRFNVSPGARSGIAIDCSGSGGVPDGAVVTRPGEAISSGQVVLYPNCPFIELDRVTAVNAAVVPDTADRWAFNLGPPDHHGYPTRVPPAQRFVQALYLDALGRPGTLAELASWVAALNAPGGSPQAVAAGIEGSVEAQDHLVRTWYAAYLGRQAQDGEELSWVALLQTGQSEEQVLSRFLASDEFAGRAQTLAPSGTPDERYVQALYQALLGRAGSEAEVAGWVGALPALGRQGVALGFLSSQEFRTCQFEGYYIALLHRPDDAQGLGAWLGSPLDIRSARIGFEASPEFYYDR
jgi:hypothetical protein